MGKQLYILIGLGLISTACSDFDSSKSSYQMPTPEINLKAENFNSCEDLQHVVHGSLVKQKQQQGEYYSRQQGDTPMSSEAIADFPAGSAQPGSGSDGDDNTGTNVQELGVDEADQFKVGKQNLYVSRNKGIEIVDKTSLMTMSFIDLSNLQRLRFYIQNQQLTVIGEENTGCNDTPVPLPGPTPINASVASTFAPDYCYYNQVHTTVRLYDVSNGQAPKLLDQTYVTGRMARTRMANGHLLLTGNSQLPMYVYPQYWSMRDIEIPTNPVIIDQGGKTVAGIACSDISRQQILDYDYRLDRLYSINTNAASLQARSIALIGGTDEMYMTTNNIYLIKQNFRWISSWGALFDINFQPLLVRKIGFDINTGSLKNQASGLIRGRISDQWAIKELKDESLSIVTTTWDSQNQNHLWVLQERGGVLGLAGSVHNFGSNETVRSVRYIKDLAYVVTFRQTDPLFAIDLSQPTNPKIVGELKIPGFSVYLHPLNDSQLFGFGRDATDNGRVAGLQFSLFDISNPLQPLRTDVQVHGNSGSNSDLLSDHHAMFYDQQMQTLAVPIVERQYYSYAYTTPIFSGAVFYQLQNDKLALVGKASHSEWIPSNCSLYTWQRDYKSLDINRVYLVDGEYMTVSRFGIKLHDRANPKQVVAARKFENSRNSCL